MVVTPSRTFSQHKISTTAPTLSLSLSNHHHHLLHPPLRPLLISYSSNHTTPTTIPPLMMTTTQRRTGTSRNVLLNVLALSLFVSQAEAQYRNDNNNYYYRRNRRNRIIAGVIAGTSPLPFSFSYHSLQCIFARHCVPLPDNRDNDDDEAPSSVEDYRA